MGIDCFRTIPILALAVAASWTGPASAAGTEDVDSAPQLDICQQVVCRAPTTVRLWTNEGAVLEGELPPGPYVLDGVINVLAGESFKVEAADNGDRFLALRYAEAEAEGDPERMLTVSLEQLVSDGSSEMVFSIENTLPHAVKFRLAANPPGTPDLIYTRTCPVAAGDWLFEKWPHPIAQLVVFDVQMINSDSPTPILCD